MNTHLKLFITALFFTGSVSIASAATLNPLELVGTPTFPIKETGEKTASSSFVYDTYHWEGVPYFHGRAHVQASADSLDSRDFSTDGIHHESGITQSWEVKLKLGGAPNELSDVWIKYPDDGGGNRNDTTFSLFLHNRADANYELITKLQYRVSEPGLPTSLAVPLLDEVAPSIPSNHTTVGSSDIGVNGAVPLPYYHYAHNFLSTPPYGDVWLGRFTSGTIIDITGSSKADAATRAWGGFSGLDLALGTGRASVESYLTFEAFATPVPEPETWAMMLAGGLLVGWQARRRGAVAAAI